MQNVEEPVTKTVVFLPLGNEDDTTNNTPDTKKDYSQTKRTSFTEKLAAMVGMKPREKEEVPTVTEKSKSFGTFSAKQRKLTRRRRNSQREKWVTKLSERQSQT